MWLFEGGGDGVVGVGGKGLRSGGGRKNYEFQMNS